MECCVAIVVLPVYLELMSLVEKFCTINVPTGACDHEGSDALLHLWTIAPRSVGV